MPYQGIQQDQIGTFFSAHDDGCGEAAVACVIKYYADHGLMADPFSSGSDPAEEVYQKYPPDARIPNVLSFGTTPGRMEDVFRAYGMATNRWCNNQDGGRQTLQQELAQNRPTPVIVDMGKLGGSWGQAHYPVAYAFDDSSIYVTNWVIGPAKIAFPWDTFMQAWQAWFIPGGDFHWAGVSAWPA